MTPLRDTDDAKRSAPGLGPRRLAARLLTRPLRALPLLALAALLVSASAWLVQVESVGASPPASADGIVVLTGGAERIATALRLLADGHASVLLVSGVGGSAPLSDVLRRSGLDRATRARAAQRDVTLGRAASSTYGNAMETAEWAQAHDVHSLIVVTAYYHMPRALLELSRVLPGVALYPVAVQPPPPSALSQLRLLADEYAKWLAARAGLSRLAAPRPLAAAAGAAEPA